MRIFFKNYLILLLVIIGIELWEFKAYYFKSNLMVLSSNFNNLINYFMNYYSNLIIQFFFNSIKQINFNQYQLCSIMEFKIIQIEINLFDNSYSLVVNFNFTFNNHLIFMVYFFLNNFMYYFILIINFYLQNCFNYFMHKNQYFSLDNLSFQVVMYFNINFVMKFIVYINLDYLVIYFNSCFEINCDYFTTDINLFYYQVMNNY